MKSHQLYAWCLPRSVANQASTMTAAASRGMWRRYTSHTMSIAPTARISGSAKGGISSHLEQLGLADRSLSAQRLVELATGGPLVGRGDLLFTRQHVLLRRL
jgi:hypothetical protein